MDYGENTSGYGRNTDELEKEYQRKMRQRRSGYDTDKSEPENPFEPKDGHWQGDIEHTDTSYDDEPVPPLRSSTHSSNSETTPMRSSQGSSGSTNNPAGTNDPANNSAGTTSSTGASPVNNSRFSQATTPVFTQTQNADFSMMLMPSSVAKATAPVFKAPNKASLTLAYCFAP